MIILATIVGIYLLIGFGVYLSVVMEFRSHSELLGVQDYVEMLVYLLLVWPHFLLTAEL